MYEFSSKSQQPSTCTLIPAGCLRYCKCTSFQANHNDIEGMSTPNFVVCDTANVRVFKQITTNDWIYIFSSSCLRYCKCTSFQANHNHPFKKVSVGSVVCDTANVRVFKQITTNMAILIEDLALFAILQMYEFSSKSQQELKRIEDPNSCLRYCKCTSFQANHNAFSCCCLSEDVVCDTANVRVFKQITTVLYIVVEKF